MPMRDLCLPGSILRACRCCSSISRKVISLEEAAREPFVVYSRNEYPDYHEWFESIFAGIAQKPRIVEEHDGASSLLPAVEKGIGVALGWVSGWHVEKPL
jgi:DNA-binding transcriptional LysR family regulator